MTKITTSTQTSISHAVSEPFTTSIVSEPLTTSILSEPIYCYDDTLTMNSSINPNGPYQNIYITNNTGTISPTWSDTITLGHVYPAPLQVHGDAEINGNLKVGGKNIGELIDRIEERLAILHPNPELEERWEKLRGLRKMYMELEAEIKEKEEIYNILKK